MRKIIFLGLLLPLMNLGFSQVNPDQFFAESRLDYYTSEEMGEILVFIPERYKSSDMSVDLVFEFQPLNRQCKVSSSGMSTVPFSMELLRDGENEITVSFNENEKWIDSRKIYVTKRPEKDGAVKIDRVNGGLFSQGMVMIPFGFFSYFPFDVSSLDYEVINGFNMISPYQKIDRKSLKSRKSYMNRCADLGMRVNYNLCSVAGGGGTESSIMEGLSTNDKKELLRKEVMQFRDHPALLTWYIADMPDSRGLPADSIEEFYRIVKELDPYHPVTLLVSSPRNAGNYSSVTDIIMTAPFPIPLGSIHEVKDYTAIPAAEFRFEKPVWVVPQAFGGNEWWTREPNPGEVRAMTYMALVSGASGVQYFIRSAPNSFPKSMATWNECAAIALEMSELTPDFFSQQPAPEFIPDQPGIHARTFNRSGLITIMVVNEKKEPSRFKLVMNDADLTISANVLFENREALIINGVLEDLIDGYGTRVYRYDTRHIVDQMKGYQPGNLVVDPDFEDISTPGVPASCFAYNGSDPGCTYFLDAVRHYSKGHSLRMNNPSNEQGNRLDFYALNLDKKKSYTISIMARTGASSNKSGGKKGGPVQFRLALGNQAKIFQCTDSWQDCQINGIVTAGLQPGNERVSPQLELTSKGTAWFDLLQVYPDLEIVEYPGSAENLKIIDVKCVHPDAKIYYTIDGSDPSPLSSQYLVPVEIQEKAPFRAKAFIGETKVGFIER